MTIHVHQGELLLQGFHLAFKGLDLGFPLTTITRWFRTTNQLNILGPLHPGLTGAIIYVG